RGDLLRRLGALHATTGISRAEVYATIFGDTAEPAASVRVSEFEDDRVGARLSGVWSADPVSLGKLIRDGYLGLAPLATRAAPEAAIIEASPETFVIAERGNARVLDEVPAGVARLLCELSIGEGEGRAWRTKEQLVGDVWGLSRYRPDRHDTVV